MQLETYYASNTLYENQHTRNIAVKVKKIIFQFQNSKKDSVEALVVVRKLALAQRIVLSFDYHY